MGEGRGSEEKGRGDFEKIIKSAVRYCTVPYSKESEAK